MANFEIKHNILEVNKFLGRVKKDYYVKAMIIFKMLKVVKKIVGIDKYILLMKFMRRFSRPENQLFLLSGFDEFDYQNENER